MWDLGRDVILCAFRAYLLLYFGKAMAERRERRAVVSFLLFLGAVLLLMILYIQRNTYLNLIGVPTIYFLLTFLWFQISPGRAAVQTMVFYTLAMLPEFFVTVFLRLSSAQGKAVFPGDKSGEFAALMVMKMVTFVFIVMVRQLVRQREKREREWEQKSYWMLLVLPVATIAILTAIFNANIHMNERNRILLCGAAVLLIAANIVVYFLFDKLEEANEERRKAELLFKKSQYDVKNLKYMESLNERHSVLIHDMNKYLRTAAELAREGNQQEILTLMKQAGSRISESRGEVYCQDKILNAILRERKASAEALGIACEVSVESGIQVDFMEELDVISIVGNLLDNAVEAAERAAGKGKVSVSLYTVNRGHFLIMKIKNPFVGLPRKKGTAYLSSKRKKGQCGIGLFTVENLVEKYGGKMEMEQEEQEFCVTVVFPIGKK